MKITSAKQISLKSHPYINEAAIQEFIFNNPSVLGLGELSPIRREKIQPSGGRLDILLGDDDTRYELEVMLGETNPDHIIRTIEYWDSEKKRYPRYNHIAVIIAEDITSRFLNVISLFNGTIPLIALQMCATQTGEEVSINFVKILDLTDLGTEEENEAEPTDRKYWESKSNVLNYVDLIFNDICKYAPNYELKYNKFYIGLSRDGVASNFIFFKPKKGYVYFYIHIPESEDINSALDSGKMDFEYVGRDRAYRIKFSSINEYHDNNEIISNMVLQSIEHRNIKVG